MKELEIAFDLKGFQGYFIKYKKKDYIGELAEGKIKPYYIFKYLYVNLLTIINNRIHLESEIHGDAILPTDITKISYDIILSEEEINYYFDEIYTKFKDNLIYYQKLYTVKELIYKCKFSL